MSDVAHIATAVQCLGDRLASELRACEEILKTEADVARRRSAQARYIALTNPRKDVAA